MSQESQQEPQRVDLEQANIAHLAWLETSALERPDMYLSGVNIITVFTYDLIQLLNQRWLQERLAVA